MAKWMHPEAGECEVFPQDENDEQALRALGLSPASEAGTIMIQREEYSGTCVDGELLPEAPKPRKSRKG